MRDLNNSVNKIDLTDKTKADYIQVYVDHSPG